LDIEQASSSIKIWISEIVFSDGTKISLNSDDIVIFVGPNNSGKTVALKNLINKIDDIISLTDIIIGLKFKLEADKK